MSPNEYEYIRCKFLNLLGICDRVRVKHSF